METILLAALLINSHPRPQHDCPQRFVKEYRVNKAAALSSLTKPCWVPDPDGKYLCTKDGCLK